MVHKFCSSDREATLNFVNWYVHRMQDGYIYFMLVEVSKHGSHVNPYSANI
jgi:hypothetical protein